MIRTEKKVIDGQEIESTQFPARRAFKYQTKIFKLLAPLASALSSVKGEGSTLDKDIDLSRLGTFASSLDEESVLDFIMILLSSTRLNGREITGEVFDLEFAGRIDLVYKIIMFVLEVNYKSFFVQGGIGKILSSQVLRTPSNKDD